jgi:tape measure domain-containing protein
MAAPELRLDVRLNLATFRTDLGRAAQTAASYYYPINLLINKQNLTKQLTAIGRSLGTTKYNIDLNDTSVDLAAGKIDKLAASLKKLSGSIQIDFNAGGGTKPLGTAMREMAAKLAKEAKGDINRAVEQMTGMRGASPFGAGTRSIPGFKAAAKGMGIENAFKLFFQELQQVDPQSLKKALDDGSVMMMQENRELKQKFDKIQSSAEGLAQDLRAMGETAKATGKASFTAGGKTLYPQNYGLKIASLLSQVEKLDKDLRSVSGQSGGELLNNLTELSSVLRTTSNSFVGIAGLSANLDQTLRGFDIATKAAASATIAYTERIRRRGGIEYGPSTQRLLPPSPTLSLREMGETMAQRYQAPSRGVKGLLPAGGKTPGEAITEAYIEELRRSFSSRSAIAGLLPPAVEPSPGAYRTVRPEPAPPVVETRAELFARRTMQAYINSAARAADERQSPLALPPARERGLGQPSLMTAPSIGESRARPTGMTGMTGSAPPQGPSGGGPEGLAFADASRNVLTYDKALAGLRESIKGVQVAQLPLVGGIKGLAGEFGQATKQVLLYGTAYKGLAFLTSLPGEAFNAAKALGTYKNQLQAVTSETGTFSNSLAFVDNLAQRFNVPLESARQGFVKLYASMQPTGFSQEQIEGLFTGISQASAAFGLSADKVDRVNYAFAQMASKGQIMSEELKGQLGDVLPGALSLFAEAAKMSIPEFSKAMEDGAFKGDAMIQVLENVGILMKVKFGAAAAGAAKTLQGALNGIQNNLKLMYEALGPVVDRMAAVFGPQVTSLIKSVTDVIKAFELGISTTGDSFAAMSPQAQGFYSSIQSILPSIKALVPSFIAAGQNIGYFALSLATASQPLLGLLKLALDFISIPFVARVAVYATIIGTLASAFTLLKNTGIIQATIAMIRFIATLTVAQVQAWISSIQSAIAALVTMARTANIAKLSLMALKVTLISFGVGAVLLGLDFVVQRLLNIGSAADDAKKRTAALTDELARAVETGNVALTSGKYVEKETEAQSLGKSKQILERFQGGFQQGASMTKQEYQQLQRAGLATGINFNERKGRATATSGQVAENLKTAQAGYVEALNAAGSAKEALTDSMQVQGNMKRELEASRSQMKDIPAATGADGDASTTKTKDKQKYVSDMAKLLQQEMQQKINAINQDASIADREREIQAAATRYDYELLINKAEYNAGINDENKKDILNRGQYLEDLRKTFDSENKLSRQRYEDVVTSPLRSILDEDKKAIIDLEGTLKMLSEGRLESTNVEIRQAQIKKALIGLDEDQIKVLQPLIDLILQTAAARDKLTEAEKRNRAFTAKMTELSNQLTLAQIIDPRAERRERIRQETGFAPEQVEVQALLEERIESAKKAKADLENIASSISNAFGEAFKGIITGTSSVREALAGMFQSIADSFADMVAQMIAEWLKAQLIQGFQSLFSAVLPGLGAAAGGLSSGFSAGTSSAIDTGAAGWASSFATPLKFANGGIATGGFTAFANGGVVTGPTLGLVGEGRYNEAVIPLPDGKSVPVDLGGMAGGMGGEVTSNIVVNINNGQMQGNGNSNGSELGRKIEGAVKQVLVSELRPGGILSSGRR